MFRAFKFKFVVDILARRLFGVLFDNWAIFFKYSCHTGIQSFVDAINSNITTNTQLVWVEKSIKEKQSSRLFMSVREDLPYRCSTQGVSKEAQH
jgi:hypothetical protein